MKKFAANLYLRAFFKKIYNFLTHSFGKITGNYYWEDYVRVYPNGIIFDRFGRRKKPSRNDINNYKNHRKFYIFASQFVRNKLVSDVGCGSGYGCKILKEEGKARHVDGTDMSKASIDFAKSRYGEYAFFTVQGITNLCKYPAKSFDIAICNEVLEHVKDYKLENKALAELKRILIDNGLMIIGTPNSEMMEDHGFSFDEICLLFKNHFKKFLIFENALVPFLGKKNLWLKRLAEGKTGVIISEKIDLSETVLPEGLIPEIKKGISVKKLKFADYIIDTSLLHNTHSWIILAINKR